MGTHYSYTISMRYIMALLAVFAACSVFADDGSAPFCIERNKLVVSANLNDKGPYLFVLDLDLARPVLDAALARNLGMDASGENAAREFAVEKVQLGNLPPRSITFLSTNLSAFKGMLGTSIAGILNGREFGKRLQLDFQRNNVAWTPEHPPNPLQRGSESPLYPIPPLKGVGGMLSDEQEEDTSLLTFQAGADANALVLSGVVNGAHIANFVLDTTLGATVAIPGRKLAEWELMAGDSRKTELEGPPDAGFHPTGGAYIRLKSLRIGDHEIARPLCAVAPEGEELRIGLGFLRHFRVTIQFSDGTLRLDPIKKGPLKEGPVLGYGLTPAVFNGAYWSLWVAKNSPAARAGLVTGGILTEVNGKDARDLSFASLSALLDAVEGGSIAVSVQQGDDLHTVLLTPEKLL